MKKFCCIVLSTVLICLTLASCMGITCETNLNSDGSGTMVLRCGFTREALEELAAASGDPSVTWDSLLAEDANETFTENGVTYYGATETHSFANLDEFNTIINSTSDAACRSVGENALTLERAADGSFVLTVNNTEVADETGAIVEVPPEGLLVRFTFNFPDTVTQIAGSTAGVTVVGHTVTIDGTKLQGTCKFTTAKGAIPVSPFSDVTSDMWHYEAVSALSSGGLVQGDGDGTFRPDDPITYAEFCQIVARANGFETGAENGYWAAKAISACKQAGFLRRQDAASPANYEKPISREEAVSAIYRMQSGKVPEINNKASSDIPDFAQISPDCSNDILGAYRLGITHGSDAQGSFKPHDNLTRAEICQLLFNINVTSEQG